MTRYNLQEMYFKNKIIEADITHGRAVTKGGHSYVKTETTWREKNITSIKLTPLTKLKQSVARK